MLFPPRIIFSQIDKVLMRVIKSWSRWKVDSANCVLLLQSTHKTVKIPIIWVSFPSLLKIHIVLFLAALFSIYNFAHLLKQKTDCFYIKALRWLFSSLILISVPHVPKSSPTNNHSFFRTIFKKSWNRHTWYEPLFEVDDESLLLPQAEFEFEDAASWLYNFYSLRVATDE